jgi:hypothetical protein
MTVKRKPRPFLSGELKTPASELGLQVPVNVPVEPPTAGPPGQDQNDVQNIPNALRAITIMMPLHFNDGGFGFPPPDGDQRPPMGDESMARRMFRRKPVQDQSKTVASDARQRARNQFRPPHFADNMNLPRVDHRIFVPALLDAQQIAYEMAGSAQTEQRIARPQQQQHPRQLAPRRPETLVKNDVMMTSISYGLLGPQPRRLKDNFASSLPRFPLNEFPSNQRPARPIPINRNVFVEEDEEKLPLAWKKQSNSVERPAFGKSRKRMMFDDHPQSLMRYDLPLHFGNGVEPRRRTDVKKSQKSKSRKQDSNRKSKKKSWRSDERQRRPFDERFSEREDKQKGTFSSMPSTNGRLALFQIFIRRQQDVAHQGFQQSVSNMDSSYFPVPNLRNFDRPAAAAGNLGPPFYMPPEAEMLNISPQLKANREQDSRQGTIERYRF